MKEHEMSYREPAKRTSRLWYVVLAYANGPQDNSVSRDWMWAIESHEAIDAALVIRGVRKDSVWSSHAICAEDFIDRETRF